MVREKLPYCLFIIIYVEVSNAFPYYTIDSSFQEISNFQIRSDSPTMKMIFRHAQEKDLPAINEMLRPWIEEDPEIARIINSIFSPALSSVIHCNVLETDEGIGCVSVWIPEKPDQVGIAAFGLSDSLGDHPASTKFLQEEIMAWAAMGVSRATIRVPQKLAEHLVPCLRGCGFIFEGICSSCRSDVSPSATFCKHFLYRSIPHTQVMGFLREFMVGLGYHVRDEEEGFSYRIRSEFQLPFVFSAWHRISKSGPDLVAHPPARIIECNELETLFYPLSIRARNEKPVLAPLDRKTAVDLLDLPAANNRQSTLFNGRFISEPKVVKSVDLAFSDPTGAVSLRKGLPALFYVNRVGAVGSGRVEDWAPIEGKNAVAERQNQQTRNRTEPSDKSHAHKSAVKAVSIRFHWYRPFNRVVKLEEIRKMDRSFQPQRVRYLSSELFQSIVAAGNGAE
jgi:hypothetical protein